MQHHPEQIRLVLPPRHRQLARSGWVPWRQVRHRHRAGHRDELEALLDAYRYISGFRANPPLCRAQARSLDW